MAVQQVEYLIKANDQMTPVMARVAESVQKQKTQIDAMAKTAKTSAGAFSALGNAMGGLPFGQVLGQFSALTGQIGALNKQTQGSTAQMLAMRGGVVALAAAAGFTLVKALVDVVYQTDAMNKEFDRNLQRSAKMAQQLAEVQSRQREFERESISLIIDPAERQRAEEEYFASVQRELAATEQSVHSNRKAVQDYEASWGNWFAGWFVDTKRAHQALEQSVEQQEARADALRKERDEIQRNKMLEEELGEARRRAAQFVEFEKTVSSLEQQNAQLRLGSDEYRRQQELVNAVTDAERQRIEQLQAEREELQQAEIARTKMREQELAEANKQAAQLADLEKTISSIEQQNLQLRLGSEEYRRQQELISAITDADRQRIEQLQAERAELEQAEIARQKAEQDRLKTEQASESYLQGLRTQLILLQEGQDAAEEYRAQLAGVSEKAIEEGRKLREEIAALQELQDGGTTRRPGQVTLAAKETRLLTRATPRDNLQEQMAKDIKKQVEQGAKQLQTANQQLAALRGLGRVPTFSGN